MKLTNRDGRIEIHKGRVWLQTYVLSGWYLTPAIGITFVPDTEFFSGYTKIELSWLKRQAILNLSNDRDVPTGTHQA